MANYTDGSFGLPSIPSIPTINSMWNNTPTYSKGMFDNPTNYLNALGYGSTVTPVTNIPVTPVATPMPSINDVYNPLSKLDEANNLAKSAMYDGNSLGTNSMGNSLLDKLDANWDSMPFDKQIGTVLGGFNSAMSAYNGFKSNKLAQDALNFNKQQYNNNYQAQRKITNSHLADRQATRVAQNANTAMSVNDYMAKYGV